METADAVPALRNPARADGAVLRVRQRVVQALQPPAVALHAHADGAARVGQLRPDAPAGQGIREAPVRHHARQRSTASTSRCRSRSRSTSRSAACCASSASPTTRTALARMKDAADGAGRGAAVGPPRDAAARHGQEPAAATTRSSSPTGPTRAWCRSSQGPFHLDDYVAYVQEFIRHIGPDVQRDLGVPAHRAGAGRGLADGQRAASRRRATMTMMGGPIDARKSPDRGQQPGDEQEPRLVREQRDLPRAARTTPAPGGASTRASCSTPASWR